jgi:hypothetical protein
MELQPQLLSSKSFGKPHASLFESNRNATFAEFGRVEQTCASYLVTSKPTTVAGHSQRYENKDSTDSNRDKGFGKRQ